MKKIHTEKAPAAIGPYSQAVVHNGVLYTSGQVPLDPVTGEIVGSDIQSQANQVLKNLEQILKEAYGSQANLTMNVSDKAIGSIVMQYSETNWEFTRRIAANFNAPVFANVDTEKPNITIGLPSSGKSYILYRVEYIRKKLLWFTNWQCYLRALKFLYYL